MDEEVFLLTYPGLGDVYFEGLYRANLADAWTLLKRWGDSPAADADAIKRYLNHLAVIQDVADHTGCAKLESFSVSQIPAGELDELKRSFCSAAPPRREEVAKLIQEAQSIATTIESATWAEAVDACQRARDLYHRAWKGAFVFEDRQAIEKGLDELEKLEKRKATNSGASPDAP